MRKDFGLEVKDVSDAGVFEGYGSTFGGTPDSYGDVVMPGAFADTLAKHRREGTMPLLLWGHNTSEPPIGNWVDMAEDGKGLWMKGQINLEDPLGARVHKALKSRAVRGLSIGYETITKSTDPKRPGVNMLEKLDLWEVSVVNFPANRRSLVTGVKATTERGEMPTIREFEDFLRDAGGFSKSKAAALASACAPHLRGEPEAEGDPLAAFWAGMRSAPIET